MSAAVPATVVDTREADGGAPARRAVVHFAWRLFRREWRQQLLILALIIVAVTATVVASAVSTDAPPPSNAGFGTASYMATVSGTDLHAGAQIAYVEHLFGRIDVIENQALRVPGSTSTYQLRAQNPSGSYGRPMLSLVSGHYPSEANQVAVTPGLASDFNLRLGGVFQVGGMARRVVGIVENPQNLLDEFALLEPGQVKSPTQVTMLFDAPAQAAPSSRALTGGALRGPGGLIQLSAASTNPVNPETISLAVLTIGMILIALMAVGGFTVLAQRRLRSLGMLASIGATDKNVSLVVRANGVIVGVVGALVGTVLGFLLWFAYRPHLEQSSHHLIGVFALPWVVVVAAVVLALVATYLGAARPARAITKLSVVAALSGRPARPTATPSLGAARGRLARVRLRAARVLGRYQQRQWQRGRAGARARDCRPHPCHHLVGPVLPHGARQARPKNTRRGPHCPSGPGAILGALSLSSCGGESGRDDRRDHRHRGSGTLFQPVGPSGA